MLATLDIAIGLILVFTCVSLVCSVLNEWCSAILTKRGRMLWRGIDQMVGTDLSAALCRHQLMESLVQKTWFGTKRSRPSYVPTQTFSLALLDVLGARASAAAASPLNVAALRQTVQALPAGDRRNDLLQLVDASVTPAATSMPTSHGQLRAAVLALPQDNAAREALLTLVEAAGTAVGSAAVAGAASAPAANPLEIAKQSIGQWYDDAMDRVTGAYKRWTQLVLFILGLLVAGVAGVDTIEIAKALQANPALRAATVQAAQKWAGQQLAEPLATVGKNGAPQSNDMLKKQLSAAQGTLAGLNIPLSPWSQEPPGSSLPDWLSNHIAGFLLTALAASLGAPFWFDLLNKFVSLRTGTKPEPQKAAS